MLTTIDHPIRVRYSEVDRMGYLHNAKYFVYFEEARTALLRGRGVSYREVEDAGYLFVIIALDCKFRRPARYDDELIVRATETRVTHVKVIHEYQIFRDGQLIAEGHSTLACVDRDGKPRRLPEILAGPEDA